MGSQGRSGSRGETKKKKKKKKKRKERKKKLTRMEMHELEARKELERIQADIEAKRLAEIARVEEIARKRREELLKKIQNSKIPVELPGIFRIDIGSNILHSSTDLEGLLEYGAKLKINSFAVAVDVENPDIKQKHPVGKTTIRLLEPWNYELLDKGRAFKIPLNYVMAAQSMVFPPVPTPSVPLVDMPIHKARVNEKPQFTYFRITLLWKTLEQLMFQEPLDLHPNIEKLYSGVPYTLCYGEAFEWTYKSFMEGVEDFKDRRVDQGAFIKFVREIPGIYDDKRVNQLNLDLCFAKSKDPRERGLTKEEFISSGLPNLGMLKYPWMNEDEVMKELALVFLLQWEPVQTAIWTTAKRKAIIIEAKRQCAAIRIQAIYRGHVLKEDYKKYMVKNYLKLFLLLLLNHLQFIII